MVAGQKFIITLKLGVTSKSDCKANSEHGFVSAKVCSDSESVSSKGQIGDLQPRVSAVWLKRLVYSVTYALYKYDYEKPVLSLIKK